MPNPDKRKLNPQAQYKSIIKEILADEIRELENLLEEARHQESWAYRNSIPTEDEGEYFFRRLNEVRNIIRKLKNRLQTVREAQRIVKKLHPEVFTSDVADGKFDEFYIEESSMIPDQVFERFDKMLEQMQNKQEATSTWFNTDNPPEEYDGIFRK